MSKWNKWQKSEISFLIKNYQNKTNKELSEILNRPTYCIASKACELKLKKIRYMVLDKLIELGHLQPGDKLRDFSLHSVWCKMIDRCENKNCPKFRYYGERGIKVCNDWRTFDYFCTWSLNNGMPPEEAISLPPKPGVKYT